MTLRASTVIGASSSPSAIFIFLPLSPFHELHDYKYRNYQKASLDHNQLIALSSQKAYFESQTKPRKGLLFRQRIVTVAVLMDCLGNCEAYSSGFRGRGCEASSSRFPVTCSPEYSNPKHRIPG